MKDYIISALTIFIITISGCNKEDRINLPDGWEYIPGEYEGTVRITPSKTDITTEFELNAVIEYIDHYSYLLNIEDHDDFTLPILQLRIIDAHHIWAYVDVVENDFYEENINTNETNRFKIIHYNDDVGIMIQDEQINLELSLHNITSDSVVNIYFQKDL